MVIGITHLQPIVALIAGILILIIPRLLNFIVAAYLIVFGDSRPWNYQIGGNPGLRRRGRQCFLGLSARPAFL